jgi:hypothetical protein
MYDLDRSQPWQWVRLPWDREVKFVRVSPDDTITPAASPVVDNIRRPVGGEDWRERAVDDEAE